MKKLLVILSCLLCLIVFASCETDKNAQVDPNHTPDQSTKIHEHDYQESTQDALCNQHQKKVFTCSVCQHSYEEELEAKGTIHTYVSTVTYPTQEHGGYTTHTCENCTESYVDSYTDPAPFSVGLAYTNQSGRYYVSGIGLCRDTEIVIPAISEQGYRVAGIAQNAFANTNVTSVTVSNGVTDIQTGAFFDCTMLRSVTLPKNAVLSEDLFWNNPVLATLTMPMSNPISYYFVWHWTTPDGYKELIHGRGSVSTESFGTVPCSLREVNILNSPCKEALSGCDMLTQITIAPNATSIGVSAFNHCAGLTQISIPETVTSIGGRAFSGTSISSITIPEKVRFDVNNQYMFENCLQLTEVKLPSNSACLPSYMFLNCEKLAHLEIPDSVTEIGGSFISGTAIERFTVPVGVTTIYTHTFNGCEKLKEIILPQNLKAIKYGAFKNCTALETIAISDSVEEIGDEAFAGCVALKQVVLPSNLKKLEDGAFKNCTSLHHVELPNNIETISYELFFGCSSLAELTLPNTVTTIQLSAFEGSGLVSITIPASVTKLGARVFANCASLQSVIFAGDNIPIENEMFLGATALESIRIPKNATQIPQRFCQGATSLKTIEFNEGLQVIKGEAFSGCISLESVVFPSSLISLWEKAFKGCTSLQSIDFSGVTLSNEATRYGGEWFADCTSLTEVKNPDAFPYINASMFKNTPLVVDENGMTIVLGWIVKVSPEEVPNIVVVPEGVTKIYDYAFSACDHIEEVILPEGVVFLGMRIFGTSDAASMVKLTVPDSLSCLSTDTICFLPQMEELVIGKGLEEFDGIYFGNLKTIRFRGTIAEFEQMPWCDHSGVQGLTIICNDGNIAPTQG